MRMIVGLQHKSCLLVLVHKLVGLEPWCFSVFAASTLFLANIMTVQVCICTER